MLDYGSLTSCTDLNQSMQTSVDAGQPDWRSKSEGSACTANIYCKSGICVNKIPAVDGTKVCVLDDYSHWAQGQNGPSEWQLDFFDGLASSAFFRPMWASLCVAGAGLAPMEWGGRQVNSPAVQSSIGAAGVLFGARSWVAWSSFPTGWMDTYGDSITTNSLRSVYMTLMDCSGSSQDEIKGMKAFANGYFCYQGPSDAKAAPPGPAPPMSARFTVASGGTGCSTTHSGRCVQSPNYPSTYNNNDHCTISVSGEASLSFTHFNTEGGNFDYVTIGTHKYAGSNGPTDIHVLSTTSIAWRTDSSNTASGWELCLSPCDAACQAQCNGCGSGGSSSGGGGGGGDDQPTSVSGSMHSTIDGIVAVSDTTVNPLLASFVHYATCWQVGVFMSVIASFLSMLLAFPISCGGFCAAADLVCCFGRCCSVDIKPGKAPDDDVATGGTVYDGDTTVVSDGGTVYDLSSPVAPLQTMAPAPAPVIAPTQEPAPAPASAASYATEPTVSDLLATCRLNQYLAGLTTLGVESVEDMKELDPEDFELEVVSTCTQAAFIAT